ncbi:MAG: hypothetical protein ACOCQI_04415 [Desulfosalsimonas sp.]
MGRQAPNKYPDRFVYKPEDEKPDSGAQKGRKGSANEGKRGFDPSLSKYPDRFVYKPEDEKESDKKQKQRPVHLEEGREVIDRTEQAGPRRPEANLDPGMRAEIKRAVYAPHTMVGEKIPRASIESTAKQVVCNPGQALVTAAQRQARQASRQAERAREEEKQGFDPSLNKYPDRFVYKPEDEKPDSGAQKGRKGSANEGKRGFDPSLSKYPDRFVYEPEENKATENSPSEATTPPPDTGGFLHIATMAGYALLLFFIYISIPLIIRYGHLKRPVKTRKNAIFILIPLFIAFSYHVHTQKTEAQKEILEQIGAPDRNTTPGMIGSPLLYGAMAASYFILRRKNRLKSSNNDDPENHNTEKQALPVKQAAFSPESTVAGKKETATKAGNTNHIKIVGLIIGLCILVVSILPLLAVYNQGYPLGHPYTAWIFIFPLAGMVSAGTLVLFAFFKGK